MKRLTAILSSDSDGDEIDISKIKNKYKNPNKKLKKEINDKATKVIKNDANQMTILDAFSKVSSTKRKSEITIDSFFQKAPKVENNLVTPEDFFSVKKTDVKECHKNEAVSKIETKQIIPHTDDTVTNGVMRPFVVECSPIVHKTKPQTIVSPNKTPTKSTERIFIELSSPMSANKKAGYINYLHREGPSALGCKEIPEGSPNCLMGLTFVITGVLDSIERDSAQSLIERCGGRVTGAISGRTTYVIVGVQPGDSKIQKANQLKIKQIDEDGLFDLIRDSTSKLATSFSNIKKTPNETVIKMSEKIEYRSPIKPLAAVDNVYDLLSHSAVPQTTKLIPLEKENLTTPNDIVIESAEKINLFSATAPPKTAPNAPENLSSNPIITKSENLRLVSSSLFVDKYRPTTLKKIVGQHGPQSPANKLFAWLKNFDANLKSDSKSTLEGSRFRAALLSGPPGIGKTTTAQLVCKELGYFVVELNASSVRSKSSIKSTLSDSLTTTSFYQSKGMKHCVIMDEVDGMAGNEDRGGINELIQIIKTTKYPIICICNDRQSRKLQSFVKYVYDLRYSQLTPEQVKATMLSVAFKEKIKLPDDAISYIIKASNYDMRQVLNNLQMWSAGSLESEVLKTDAKNACKEFKIGPFDVVRKVFSHDELRTYSDKSELFFQDYQLGGLFVQENYPNVRPNLARNNSARTMRLMSLAADSIAMGDIVSAKMHATNNWNLLPTQAMFSSVIPGEYLHGRMSDRVEFPSWLGKFSKANKNSRILSSLCSHLCLSTKGGVVHPSTLSLDYGDLLVKRLVTPLREGDIETVLSRLSVTQLLKDDMDLLIEATCWPHLANPLDSVSSQIKASLTRAYNKSHFKLPYANVSVKKSMKASEPVYDREEGAEDDMEEEELKEEDDIESDVMIVKKKMSKKSTGGAEEKVTKTRKTVPKKAAEPKVPKEKKVTAKRAKKQN